jgi:hypothetical protein
MWTKDRAIMSFGIMIISAPFERSQHVACASQGRTPC